MTIRRVYLVIRADQSVRAAYRPRIASDEVAIAINLRFPNSWGRVTGELSVDVPEFAPDAELPSGGES